MGELVIYLFVWHYTMCFAYIANMFSGNKKAFTIFTGDITSHDNDNQLSRAYVEYVQSAVYSLFKAYLAGPVYAVLVCLVSFYLRLYLPINVLHKGNHDTWPQAFDAPHSIQPETLSNQFEWNYAHLAE
jgi:sphingomyelin phosphodiesterase